MRVLATILAGVIAAGAALADTGGYVFASIDGGTLNLSDWAGQPVLVVNTASQCAFTGQYAALQALYDQYRGSGLVVLAVPSDDFNQELGSAEEVKEFCEMNFGLDMPMADITPVKGANAHSFYKSVRNETGFVPRWNFNKVLIDRDGEITGTWGSGTKPMSPAITQAVEKALAQPAGG